MPNNVNTGVAEVAAGISPRGRARVRAAIRVQDLALTEDGVGVLVTVEGERREGARKGGPTEVIRVEARKGVPTEVIGAEAAVGSGTGNTDVEPRRGFEGRGNS